MTVSDDMSLIGIDYKSRLVRKGTNKMFIRIWWELLRILYVIV